MAYIHQETCTCGAAVEIQTVIEYANRDVTPEYVTERVREWRRSHKHEVKKSDES